MDVGEASEPFRRAREASPTQSLELYCLATKEAEEALHRAVQASRVLFTLSGHTDWVGGVAYSPDGTRLATAGTDGKTKIWDAETGRELLILPGGGFDVAFGPDGTRLARGLDSGAAKVWDAETGQELITLTGHAAWTNGVAFSPDGTRLASVAGDWRARSSSIGELFVWDVMTGEEMLSIKTDDGGLLCVDFDDTGRQIVAGGTAGSITVLRPQR